VIRLAQGRGEGANRKYSPVYGECVKQVLVAVDEHEHSTRVMENAIILAKALPAKIVIIYVVENEKVPNTFVDVHGDSLPEHYYLDEYHRTVDQLEQKIHAAGIEHDGVCGVGAPRELILRTAKKRGVDYIVMGFHEYRGLSRLKALGEATRGVIEKADVPVMAVP
jgi:nucleotide-binding universal stress UspA family protein